MLTRRRESKEPSEYNYGSPFILDFASSNNFLSSVSFFKVNPNGRVPALVDHDENDLTIWESGAILNYLSEKFDPNGVLSGKNLAERAQIQTWLFYQVSGMGPVQGQCVYMGE